MKSDSQIDLDISLSSYIVTSGQSGEMRSYERDELQTVLSMYDNYQAIVQLKCLCL